MQVASSLSSPSALFSSVSSSSASLLSSCLPSTSLTCSSLLYPLCFSLFCSPLFSYPLCCLLFSSFFSSHPISSHLFFSCVLSCFSSFLSSPLRFSLLTLTLVLHASSMLPRGRVLATRLVQLRARQAQRSATIMAFGGGGDRRFGPKLDSLHAPIGRIDDVRAMEIHR